MHMTTASDTSHDTGWKTIELTQGHCRLATVPHATLRGLQSFKEAKKLCHTKGRPLSNG